MGDNGRGKVAARCFFCAPLNLIFLAIFLYLFMLHLQNRSALDQVSVANDVCVCVPGTSVPLRCIAETEAGAAVAESATNRPAKENERERERKNRRDDDSVGRRWADGKVL